MVTGRTMPKSYRDSRIVSSTIFLSKIQPQKVYKLFCSPVNEAGIKIEGVDVSRETSTPSIFIPASFTRLQTLYILFEVVF